MPNNKQWERRVGVYGICVRDGKILVIEKRRGPYRGRYDLPGGKIESGESLFETIRREVLEETGFSVESAESLGLCEFLVPWNSPGGEYLHHISLFFAITIHSTPPTNLASFDGQDSAGSAWIPIDQCTEGNVSPLVTQAVRWYSFGAFPTELQRLDNWEIREVDEA